MIDINAKARLEMRLIDSKVAGGYFEIGPPARNVYNQ